MSAQGTIEQKEQLRFGCIWLIGFFAMATAALAQYPAQYPSQSQVPKDGTAVLLEDYATLPASSPTHGGANNRSVDFKGQLGRVTSMRSEPSNAPLAASRFFVNDQSGTLYILDKNSKQFTAYLNFPQIFPKFVSDTGNTAGIVSIAFDPGTRRTASSTPCTSRNPTWKDPQPRPMLDFSSLNLTGYAITPAVNPPAGPANLESVLVEWTDTNIRNASFEGTARELLRVGFDRNHPMADMVFNPLARPGNPDYGNLYVSVGDGAQGETPGPDTRFRSNSTRLVGKILRITPDMNLRPEDMLSANGRYRIPSTRLGPESVHLGFWGSARNLRVWFAQSAPA